MKKEVHTLDRSHVDNILASKNSSAIDAAFEESKKAIEAGGEVHLKHGDSVLKTYTKLDDIKALLKKA